MNEATHPNTQKPSYTPLFIALSFFVPFVGASLYFYFGSNHSMGNHGELLTPPLNIAQLKLHNDDGKKLADDQHNSHWRMIYFTKNGCNDDCKQRIYIMRQSNIALGKNAHRFHHMLIHSEKMDQDFEQLITQDYPNALRAYAKPEYIKQVHKQALSDQGIYIVDPHGNIMMRFTPDIPTKKLLKDLKRLLKISRIG